jgi:hypothetical protein
MILGTNNAGWKGYLANAATGAAFTLGANEFVSPAAAQASIIGAGVILLDRVLTEQFSPVGAYLSLAGIGDATAATRLGEISEGYYIHPTIFDNAGNPIVPHQITDAAVRAFAAMPAAGKPATAAQAQLQGIQTRPNHGRFQDRFASRF